MKKIIAAVILSISIAPAFASGLYVGAKTGKVNYNYSNVTNNGQNGLGIFAGYQFNENFSLEIESVALGGFDTVSRKYKGVSGSVNGVGSLPLNEQFEILAKIGVASTTIKATAQPGWVLGGETSHSNTGLTLGFAAQFNITKGLGVRAGIDSYPIGNATVGTSNASLASIGVVFKF